MARTWPAITDDTTEAHAQHRQPSSTPGPPDEATLALDTVCELLQNQRRRHVIRYLATTDGAPAFRDVVTYVVAQEYDQAAATVTAADRKTVYVSLYQNHIPKLAKADVITYEGTAHPIHHDRHFAELVTCLTALEQARPPSQHTHAGQGGGGRGQQIWQWLRARF